MKSHRSFYLPAVLLLLPAIAQAQPAAARPEPATKPAEFVLHPSAFPSMAIQYRLLPDVIDLEPGNAAPLYLLGCTKQLLGAENKEMQKELEELESAAPEQMDHDRARKVVGSFQGALRQVELAARRDYCRWDLPARTEGYNMILAHMADLRFLARVLCLEAKLQIAEGNFDQAAHTLQTCFGLGQHLNQDAFLIQLLVGTAISDLALKRVEQWITKEVSPNLYWSLTQLPAPFFDIRSAMEMERAGAYYSIPHLKEAAAGKMTLDHFQEMVGSLNSIGKMMQGDQQPANNVWQTLQAATAVATSLPEAKAMLLEMGYSKEKLDAMQPPQIVAFWWAQSYERAHMNMSKALALPFYQDATAEAGTKNLHAGDQSSSNVLLMTVPAVYSARVSVSRLDRHIGELRSLEAIRGYAAIHNGELPRNLAEIPGIPTPIDPATGLAYSYRVENNQATLNLPIPHGAGARYGWQDLITVKK
jgi:hypothetical protein